MSWAAGRGLLRSLQHQLHHHALAPRGHRVCAARCSSVPRADARARADGRMNDIVLAKLLKLKYLRRLCASGAKSSLQPYAALLVALLQRPSNAVNLTLQ
eukprot:3772770-Rhodomonas_salina.1